MNENIDLTKILKDCPKGTKLYSLVHGEVEFQKSDFSFTYPIVVKLRNGFIESFTSNGKLFNNYDGECILFPSREQRDWSKFTAHEACRTNSRTQRGCDGISNKDY